MRSAYFILLLVFISRTFSEKIENEGPCPNKEDISCVKRECRHKRNSGVEASNIAQKAAQDAKAAEEAQLPAGQQAAHQVKEQLAEKAVEAAKAADAALSGKEAVVDELQSEMREAEVVENEELASLHQLQQTVQSANKATQEAQAELKLLQTSLQLAQGESSNAQQALEGDELQLKEKEQLVEAERDKLDSLSKQLKSAKCDLSKTRDAARKAEAAAAGAKQNAIRNKRKTLRKDDAK